MIGLIEMKNYTKIYESTIDLVTIVKEKRQALKFPY